MLRNSFYPGPPADAHCYKSLKWVKTIHTTEYVTVQMWRGKASKPFAHYRFPSEVRADQWITEQREHEDGLLRAKAARRVQQATDRDKAAREMVVGAILHYSWGYDQTQCDYFEIVARRGLMVTIRPIASKAVPGSEGFMSDSRCPAPGQFTGPPIRKRIVSGGLSMDHGIASVVHPWEKHYSSWYA